MQEADWLTLCVSKETVCLRSGFCSRAVSISLTVMKISFLSLCQGWGISIKSLHWSISSREGECFGLDVLPCVVVAFCSHLGHFCCGFVIWVLKSENVNSSSLYQCPFLAMAWNMLSRSLQEFERMVIVKVELGLWFSEDYHFVIVSHLSWRGILVEQL